MVREADFKNTGFGTMIVVHLIRVIVCTHDRALYYNFKMEPEEEKHSQIDVGLTGYIGGKTGTEGADREQIARVVDEVTRGSDYHTNKI
jgi:hypothetical protein